MGLEDFNRKELERIKENLAKEQDFLKQYEDELRFATDPREKSRLTSNIERQKQAIAKYKQQYLELQQELSTGSSDREEVRDQNSSSKRTILVLAASPVNEVRLRLDEEVREIENGLQLSEHRERFSLQQKWAVRPDDLRRALLKYQPQIVHFCGHGTGVEGLALENNLGEAQLVSTIAIADLFELFASRGLECVVLNACYSEVQAEAIAQHIDYVVGMNQAIGDRAAIKFAVGFYDALGAGCSYEEAYKFGRNAIALEGIAEELTPVFKKKVYLDSIDGLSQQIRKQACEKVKRLYSKIRLLNGDLIDVDRLYVDVYLLNRVTAKFRATITDLLNVKDIRESFDRFGLAERGKRSPSMEVVKKFSNLMILGKPGSGKTTLLRHIVVACSKEKLFIDRVPILIEFRKVQDISNFDLLEIIQEKLEYINLSQLKGILDNGELLILLDGLDEILSDARKEVQKNIDSFSKKYHKNRFIITCRTQASEYRLDNFEYVEVADFNEGQVEEFAENWFANSDLSDIEKKTQLKNKFINNLKLEKNKPIADLAVTPILLSLTCWVFSDLKKFPDNRSELYQEGIELLLEKWDEDRGIARDPGSELYKKMKGEERQELLSDIAFTKFQDEQYALFNRNEISEYLAEYLNLTIREVRQLPAIVESQHGLLVERAKGIYSFSHLTFQEFLTAQYISKDPSLIKDLVENHITDTRWREVFLLLAELLNQKQADTLLLAMEEKIHSYINTDKLQAFLDWADSIIDPCPSDLSLLGKRAIAIHFALALAKAKAYANANAKAYANANANANALLTYANAKALLTYAEAYAKAKAYAYAYPYAKAKAYAYAKAYAKAAKANNAYAKAKAAKAAKAYVEEVRKLTIYKNVDFDGLLVKLIDLKEQISEKNLSSKAIVNFLKDLNRTLLEGFHLTEQMIDFSEEEFKSLENYFYAAKLMLDCKNAAVRVSQKTWNEIEDRMFRPTSINT